VKHSIVIPAYNEAENIESFVEEFVNLLPPGVREVLTELLIVENGSADDTLAAGLRLQDMYPHLIRVISTGQRSYGSAIRRGIFECSGTHISILECDFLDVGFLKQSVELFQQGNGRFIVGSKRHPEAKDERPWKRRISTHCLAASLKFFLGYPGSDTRGLKSIEADLARELCDLSITGDEALQTELVLLAWRIGVEIREVPVSVRESRSSPRSFLKRLPRALDMLIQLRNSLRQLDTRLQRRQATPADLDASDRVDI
jgi:glycosyltransferase involved in cell wall biosynthesis